jgi:hypothetical protein
MITYVRSSMPGFAALIAEVPAPAFTVSIDKQRHLERYKVWQFSPYHYVMTCLLERFVQWLERTGNVGDVMGEARNPTHDAQLRRAFRFFHKNGTSWVKAVVVQKHLLSKELRLEDKIANVAGLQLADGLAHPAHRSFKFKKLGQPIQTTMAHFSRDYLSAKSTTGVHPTGKLRAMEKSGCPKKQPGGL